MKNIVFSVSTRFFLLCAALLPMLATGPALAQQTQGKDTLEEVTVTGSRIARRDFESQSPIVTINAETFTERGNIGIESALNQMPQFNTANAGSSYINSAAQTPFPAADAAPGAATINLRGLGINRNLVLVDGRRAQPINAQLVVDLNTIPSAAIDRVETITGGAAAVYGADAIAGVTNFILKKDFEGMQVDAQYGISQEGDGQEMQFSGLFGTNFADGRGNVMIGANYSDRRGIDSKNRGWARAGWTDTTTTTGGLGGNPLSQFQPDTFGNPPAAGAWLMGQNFYIDQNGAVFDSSNPLNPAHPYTGSLNTDDNGFIYKINPDGTLGSSNVNNAHIQIPLSRYSMFGSAHFAVTDHINMFTDMRYAETFASASGFTSSVGGAVWAVTIPYDPNVDDPASPNFGTGTNRHPVPAELAALLNSRPTPDAPWTYGGGLDYIPGFTTETTTNLYQITGGFNGDIDVMGRNWTWELYGSHGKSTVNARQPEGFPYIPRIQNLFSADLYGQDFDISSLPGYFPLAVTGHCTSGLPIFKADGSVDPRQSISQDCADYILLRMNNITTLTQEVGEANIQGGLFDLPAGELKFALGADYRREDFKFDPDSGFNANQDFPNVDQNIILPTTVDGSTSVKEVYAEVSIPVVKDLPFVKSFEIDPGVRWSDYNTTGGAETYKIMGDWSVNDWMRFRGGYQSATRSPNVAELFTPKGGSQIQGVNGTTTPDPCAWYANFPGTTPEWGNTPTNPNRLNVQILCQYLMTRDGAPASLYVPGQNSANNYVYTVFGNIGAPFPYTIAVTEGNPNLDPETAKTWTAGIVLHSPVDHPLLDRLTLSADFFIITVDGAIAVPNHNSVYQQCVDAQYNTLVGDAPGAHTGAELAAGSPTCALIEREYIGGAPGTNGNFGAPRRFKAQTINQGGIKTKGIDIQLDWGADFADMGFLSGIPGSFSTNILVSYLDKYAESSFPGAAFIDYTGSMYNNSYDYQLLSSFNYTNGPLYVGLRWQHLPSMDPPPGSGTAVLGVKSHDQLDLFGRWNFGERYTVRAGIDNLLNADPEIVGATTTNTARGATSSGYDQIGRKFYFGLTANF